MNKNLIPFNERTEDEQRDIARKGGKASGESRRKRKSAKEFAIAALYGTIKDKDGNDVFILDAAIKSQVKKAIQDGDLNSLKYLIELIGDAPSNKVDINSSEGIQINFRKYKND